jgi:hypothetical protein
MLNEHKMALKLSDAHNNELAQKLEIAWEQRDEALEYADKLAQGLPDGMLPKDIEVLREANCGLAMELTAVTEQRDELLRYNEAFRKETLICADCDAISKGEYDQAIEQRDKAWQKIENQAERITYLEGATNHATGTPLSKAIKQRDRLADLVKQFIYILDITEESNSGRLFHPTNITSCRAGDLQKIGELVEALRRASRTTNQNEQ